MAFSFFAFAEVDIALKVNSAFYTDNIIDKQPENGKYLMINVSVKNNGQDTITVSNDQFTPMMNGEPVEKYAVFIGDDTDLQRQIQIPSGESKDLLVIFDIGDQKPDSVEYNGPLSWAPNYKTNTTINTITPGVPFNGMNQTSSINLKMNGEVSSTSIDQKINGTNNEVFETTDELNQIKETSIKSSTKTIKTGEETTIYETGGEETGMIDLNTGLYINGTTTSSMPKNLTKEGDTTTIGNDTYTIVGSEQIDKLGHKIDCWKVEGSYDAEGTTMKAIIYYDKTTRMTIKRIMNKQNVVISDYTLELEGSGELISTNAPLIGIA